MAAPAENVLTWEKKCLGDGESPTRRNLDCVDHDGAMQMSVKKQKNRGNWLLSGAKTQKHAIVTPAQLKPTSLPPPLEIWSQK